MLGNIQFFKLRIVRLSVEVKKMIDMMNILKSINGYYLITTIVYRILITIPVIIASA